MDRFERQRRFFGDQGHERLRATTVAVVGVGGLGSHVVQQLAYLGVGKLALIDPDTLEDSNRNRLIGSRAADAVGTSKVVLAERLVREIDPSIEVLGHATDFRSNVAERALQNAVWIFGCVDNDGARLLLTQRCAETGKVYVDTATEIHVADGDLDYGGRVCVAAGGRGCPFCLGLLSQEDIRRSLASEEQRKDLAGIYGVDPDALGGSGPAVVYLNGIIASIAVAEFAAAVTGLRAATRLLEYRGKIGVVTMSMDEPEADCPYCEIQRGSA